ncbi:hypothetical protein L2E82_51648 [Cichorium intybus]|nr:hypothetical protein L2E82_51648 [Cichorium intybus]
MAGRKQPPVLFGGGVATIQAAGGGYAWNWQNESDFRSKSHIVQYVSRSGSPWVIYGLAGHDMFKQGIS